MNRHKTRKRSTSSTSRLRNASSNLKYESLESRQLLATVIADFALSGPLDWTDGSSWIGGSVPGANDRAVIPQNTTVQLDGTSHTVGELIVMGTLEVPEVAGVDRSLTSNWVHINSGGVFQVGTAADRYDQAEFVLTLSGTDQNADYTVETATGSIQINNNDGFLMAAGGGRLQFFGQDKISFTKLGATANVGSNSIVVENVIERNFDGTTSAASDGQLNWEVGDQIVIASSTRDYADQEVRTITAISDLGDGTTRLTLNANLSKRHYGQIETYDNSARSIDLRAEVALLSRNVRVEGLASQDTDSNWGNRALFNSGSTGDHRGISGHIMIMQTAGQITVEGVQLDRLGQTGTLGRYPIHWHLAGDRSGDVLKGVSVTNSNNRGVTVHGTHNLLIQDVVLHDIHGHGFFMEDGVETGNQYLSNIALGIHKVGRSDAVGNSSPDVNDPFIVDTHDFVAQNALRFLSSSAYWVTNPDNTWVGNISAGVDGTGFWFILPEFALGESANDPQYNNVNANETPLGLFDHNLSHSSHVGFNQDRGMDLESPIGASLLNNSFGRAYQPEDGSGNRVEPVYSNFTAYKHEIGIYHRARYGRFHQNAFADNFTSTFITFSQRITDSLYVGHSIGNADLSEVVTGQSLYDGPNFMDGTHFAGFNRGNSAHVFRNHGGALRNTHVYVSNTSFENDGTAGQLSISERYGATYNANRDAFDFQAPTAIYDVDGTLTGHGGGTAGSVLVPDNNFITDSNDVRPAGWDARVSDDLYANFRFEFDGNNQGRLTLVAPDGDSDTESSDDSHRTIIKANNEVYTINFPDGPSSYGDGFEILYRIQLGNTDPATITESSIIRFTGIADELQVLNSRNRFNGGQRTNTTQVASLAELETVAGPGYWVDGDDLVVKFVTVASESIRYFFTPGSNTPIDPPPNENELNVAAIDDAYIQDSSTNDNTLLRVEDSGSRTRTSYLKFDVPDPADKNITGASLQLTVSGDAGNNMRIRIYEGGSDGWTEGSLTTGNAPAKTTLLDEITGNWVIGQTYTFDVSAAVVAGQTVSFVIDSDGAVSTGDVAFASEENSNSTIRPKLVLSLDDAPATAPNVVSVVRDGGDESRPDIWSTLQIEFDTDVRIFGFSLQLFNDTDGGSSISLAGSQFDYDSTNFVATWNFDNMATPLQEAYYTYNLSSLAVTTTDGETQMDGDGNGTAGGDLTGQVYVAIPGDADLDGDVDIIDSDGGDGFTFVQNLGMTSGATWADGDFDGDGDVDIVDSFPSVGDGFLFVQGLGKNVRPLQNIQSFSSALAVVSQTVPAWVIIAENESAADAPPVVLDHLRIRPVSDHEETSTTYVERTKTDPAATPGIVGDQDLDEVFSDLDPINQGEDTRPIKSLKTENILAGDSDTI